MEYNQELVDVKTMFLIELKNSGMLKKLYRFGLITPHIFMMAEARVKVRALMKAGMSKAESVKLLARDIGKHEKHVYTYLR